MALVSIITVVKDDAPGLRGTFSSLLEQDETDWEMQIVVGTSIDSTLQTAISISKEDSRVKVIEQVGRGIYGAMNEGLQAARGKFCWFMNAGDRFADAHVLGNAVREITEAKLGLLIGDYRIEGGNGRHVQSHPKKHVTRLAFAFNRRGGCHQAMIFRTNVLKEIGGYDLRYSLGSDFDLVLKVIKLAGATRTSEVYASIEPGGLADQGIFLVHKQKHQIRRELFGSALVTLLSFSWTIAARAKILLRRLMLKARNQ